MKIWGVLGLSGLLIFSGAAMCRAEGRARFAPPDGKVLLVIGTDKVSTDDYVRGTGIMPGGTMLYTSIQSVDSLDRAVDVGGGIQDGKYLLERYPQSVVQLGLWMVGGLEEVARGTYDANIDKLAAWIKSARRPVFLRIGYEFDLPANQYEPGPYKLAFRYIVDRIRAQGVTNVAFVWHSYANLPRYPWDDWYPGDEYVDWFAVSVFERPNVYARKFAERAREHHKGFMIAEATPERSGITHGQASWDHWFAPFFKFVEASRAEIVCYIPCDWDSIPMFKDWGWGDARVQTNPVVLRNWKDEILKDKYLHASPRLFKALE